MIFKGTSSASAKFSLAVAFALSFLLAGYVLLVPANLLVGNVKLRIYNLKKSTFANGILVAQEGEETIYGPGPLSVRFPVPFKEPPEVELINFLGDPEDIFPRVVKTTRFQFIVEREQFRVYSEDESEYYPDKFKWIATGAIMEEISRGRHGE